jgi:hypothetical protein
MRSLLFAEVCRLVSIVFIILLLLIFIELLLCLLMLSHLSVKYIEILERLVFQGPLLLMIRPLHH